MTLNISRRDFLKTTSVAAAGATAASITPFSSAYARRDRASRIVIAKDEECYVSGVVDQEKVNDMVDNAILTLTEAASIPEAYEALFPEQVTTSTTIAVKQNSVSAGSSNRTWTYVRDALKNGLTKMLNGTFPESNIKVEKSGTTNSSNPSFQIGNRTFGFRNPWVEADYIINAPVCWAHSTTYGVTLSLKNMMSSCSSHSNFHDFDYSYSSNPWQAILSSQPTAKNKQILVLIDAISARAKGGPGGSADCTPLCVLAGKDMVAMDYQGIQILKANGLSSTRESNALTKLACATQSPYNLGTDNPNEMEVIEIEPPWVDPVAINPVKSDAGLSSQVKIINNAANSMVTFQFPMYTGESAKLSIFNMQGKIVWSSQLTGKNSIMWNAKNSDGKSVQQGMFVYNLQIGVRTASGKVEIRK